MLGSRNDIFARLPGLAEAELVNRMKGLIALERGTSAELIAHIAELDTRDLHLREGYSSLFVYAAMRWGSRTRRPTTGSRSRVPSAGLRRSSGCWPMDR